MIAKSVDQITEEDLQALKDNSVSEGKAIEYKQSLPSKSDSGKKEFLADVSSFANASGGDLIYGVSESKGIITAIDGLEVDDIDQEISRLENIIRTGIQPRLTSVTISPPIPLESSKVALIIRIPKSWISPHRVSFKGHDKFYSRSSNGKYPLDVAELRVAFNLSETITERIRNFRQDRIAKIFANETPVPFYDNAKIVLHLIPIISFNPAQSYDISEIASHPEKMPPIRSGGWNRYNLDGFLTYDEDREGRSRSYVQLFRNGIIEAIEGWLLRPHGEKLIIPSIRYEAELIKSLSAYLSLLRTLNVETPVFIFLTLLGVEGYSMAVDEWRFWVDEIHTIDRDILLLPEVIMQSYDDRAEDVLRPCFDAIWNACGYPRDLYYNDAGEWAPKG
ncbi:hypothetical protein ES705_04537 [subsurface metagenome]